MVARLRQSEVLSLVLLAALYLATRCAAFFQPYHQDEYKWALTLDPAIRAPFSIPHPFLSKVLYTLTGDVFGFAHLRLLPIALSCATLVLLYFYVRRMWGTLPALVAGLLWTANLYALIGSAQIDIDGAFLPLAALITFFGYHLWRSEYSRTGLYLAAVGIIIGFCIKLSFVLVPLAFAVDYLWRTPDARRKLLDRRVLFVLAGILIVAAASLAILWSRFEFLAYVGNFIAIGGRSYSQMLFETVKAIIYLSPLLVFGAVLGWRYRKDLSLWYVFLGLNILFYFVLFDFTHRTLDRYIMFATLPACVITAVALVRIAREYAQQSGRRLMYSDFAWTFLIGAAAIAIFDLPHRIIPLIPKTAFIHAVAHGEWRFLLPLSGGSGPLGFYLPVDGIALLFGLALVSVVVLLVPRMPPVSRRHALVVFVAAGLIYNTFAMSEYLSGVHYGSSARVLSGMVEFMRSSDIPKVITYNDIGAYELTHDGKYYARLYTDPMFEEENMQKIAAYKGYYFVLDVPEINPSSRYWTYFTRCKTMYEAQDKEINGYVFDCRAAKLSTL